MAAIYARFKDPSGKWIHQVNADHLEKAKKIDPDLRVLWRPSLPI